MPNKKKKPAGNTPARSLRVPSAEWAAWTKWCRANDVTITDVIRQAMNDLTEFRAEPRVDVRALMRRRYGNTTTSSE